MLVPWKKLLLSFVTPGNSGDEGYDDVRFIAQARLVSARTQYRAQAHKHIPTKRDGTPSKMGLWSGSQTLDCLLGKCLIRKIGVMDGPRLFVAVDNTAVKIGDPAERNEVQESGKAKVHDRFLGSC